MKGEKRKKPKYPISNQDICPVCNKEWELCNCDQLYPEPELIRLDDELILSAIDFEV